MKIFSGLLDFNSFESFSGLSRSQKEMSKGIPLRIGVCPCKNSYRLLSLKKPRTASPVLGSTGKASPKPRGFCTRQTNP